MNPNDARIIEPGESPPGYYVYLLCDDRDGSVFYVGKGHRRRHEQHLKNVRAGREANPAKYARIAQILVAGGAVVARCAADGLSEAEALRLERRTIAAFGIQNLTNLGRGQLTDCERSQHNARQTLARFKSFEQWSSEARRAEWEVAMFHRIRSDLTRLVEHGDDRTFRTVTVTARKVVGA